MGRAKIVFDDLEDLWSAPFAYNHASIFHTDHLSDVGECLPGFYAIPEDIESVLNISGMLVRVNTGTHQVHHGYNSLVEERADKLQWIGFDSSLLQSFLDGCIVVIQVLLRFAND